MSAQPSIGPLNRYTEISELSGKVRNVIKRIRIPLIVALAAEWIYLVFIGRPGAEAFALIGVGTSISLSLWPSRAVGLPLLPMMVIQSLIIYGVPIAVGHEIITTYPPGFVTAAGFEVMVFDLVLGLAWIAGMRMFRPAPPVSYVLQEFNRDGIKGWARLGFGLISLATGFQVLQGMNLADGLFALLPGGSNSIIYALVSVVSACGFFLASMMIGGKRASLLEKIIFWAILVLNGMISAQDFILASAAANLITVAVGFFWSDGRVPWRYLVIAMTALSFLNMGKTTMRERHWGNAYEPATQRSFLQLPAYYAEWINVSLDALIENNLEAKHGSDSTASTANKNQTLLDRIDNLQNLLFVIDAIETDHVAPLHGQTYAIIPPLLVPRIFWPDKPRSHEGQVLLNVHFGRQDLNSTLETYIAWGLLPEAYGNFGAITGSIVLGLVLGLLFAWIENYTSRKLVMSTEGFLSLSLLMNMMNSFEMVASVLVTATFQSFIIIIAASMPFVRRTVIKPTVPDDTGESESSR
jgi:hypothetical protein